MKLIIAGATGFVAGEVIRQSLRMPQITSIVALSRKPIPSSNSGDQSSKLKNVLVKDYDDYPDHVRKEFANANACIWTVAITPSKTKGMDPAEVKRVCQTFTMAGFRAMYEAGPARPFRFVYMSGINAERDQTKTPSFYPEYSLMRGETESMVLDYAAQHPGEIEACAMKVGFITAPGAYAKQFFAYGLKMIAGVPSICVTEATAAMLHQAIHGFEKEPLMNDDLVRIGCNALKLDDPSNMN